jgi:hypothetical protein
MFEICMLKAYMGKMIETRWTKEQAKQILRECDELEKTVERLRQRALEALKPSDNVLYGEFTKKAD